MTKEELVALSVLHEKFNSKTKLIRDTILIIATFAITWIGIVGVKEYWGDWLIIAGIVIAYLFLCVIFLAIHWGEGLRCVESYLREKELEAHEEAINLENDKVLIEILRESETMNFIREDNRRNLLKYIQDNIKTENFKLLQGLIYREKGYTLEENNHD